jgi:PhnB protein
MTAASRPSPIPDRYRRITPALAVQGGDTALKFYAEVFGATERVRSPGPDGTIASHVEDVTPDEMVRRMSAMYGEG